MTVVGNRLYVVALDQKVRVYDATTGASLQGGFHCRFMAPARLVCLGNFLYLPDYFSGRVAIYDVTTGKEASAAAVTGVPTAEDIAFFDGALYVLTRNGIVAKFDAMTAAAINPTLVSGLVEPSGLAVSNNTIYVSTRARNTIATYDATTGACLIPSLIEGLLSSSILQKPEASPLGGCRGAGFLGESLSGGVARSSLYHRLLAVIPSDCRRGHERGKQTCALTF